MLEFARSGANPQALSLIEALCIRYGVPIEAETSAGAPGLEDDSTAEDEDEDE